MLIVITGSGDDQHIAPRKLSDTTWDETVADIARGEWTDVSQVIQASTGFDVIEQIAREVAGLWAANGEPLKDWQRDFIEQNLGIRAANHFQREEA